MLGRHRSGIARFASIVQAICWRQFQAGLTPARVATIVDDAALFKGTKQNSVKILVIGGGGREHALVWKLRESPRVEKIWCAPGNGGIADDATCLPVESGDVDGLVAIAEKLRPDLTVIGPELPLVNGLSDALRARNLAVVGPSQIASQLEGSKVFTKNFLARHSIPTAEMYGDYSSPDEAYAALAKVPYPLVVKADGLCAGKGVLLAQSAGEARDFITRAMLIQEFGAAGKRIMLEETLEGDELSFIIVTDGDKYAVLAPTRDHKRAFDGDRGPNTGGMGTYSADSLMSANLRKTIEQTIVEPTLRGLIADGIRYQGFLFIGLMLTTNGPKVLEFNCRLGDPETQSILARVDFDLAEALLHLATRRFNPDEWKWKSGASACIVIASGGYPGRFETGRVISGLTDIPPDSGVKILHAGTRRQDEGIVTSGGRVLGVTAFGPDLAFALTESYGAAAKIRFEGMHYRNDIGGGLGKAKSARD
jgi:phosphoribosylamine--glycine ligase